MPPTKRTRTIKADAMQWLAEGKPNLIAQRGRGAGKPSPTRIALEAGIEPTRLIRVLNKERPPSADLIDALVIYAMRTKRVGRAHADSRLFNMPESAPAEAVAV